MEIIKYQWIKGDHIGTTEEIINQDSEWIIFLSGRRIAASLIDEFMIPINTGYDVLDFNSTKIENKPTVKSIVKPKKTFMYDLIENIKFQEDCNVSVEIKFKLPKKEMISVLISSYDETEVMNTLKDYILNQINIEGLHKHISDKLNDISVIV
jgi:hypothetical protein